MNDLRAHLEAAASAEVLLIASDFDGTIAPIVDRPEVARPLPTAQAALQELSTLANTHVAIVSGRALDDLKRVAGFHPLIELVGSHGIERSDGSTPPLSPREEELLQELNQAIASIAARDERILAEFKPFGIALHYRLVPELTARTVISDVLAGPARLRGVYVRYGRKVIELWVRRANKGEALLELRRKTGATFIAFFGDDETDEDALAALDWVRDFSVKVGPRPSLARYGAAEPAEAAEMLSNLAAMRRSLIQPGESEPRTAGERNSDASRGRSAASGAVSSVLQSRAR